MLTKQHKIAIAAGLVVVTVGGGWLFAKHQANVIAKDQIDGFIIRHNLGGTVAYRELSASPFGSATLSDVSVRLSPATAITVGSLSVSDLTMKNNQVRGFTVTAEQAQVPLLALAREHRDNSFAEALGLGYTVLGGNITLSAHYDDEKNLIAIESAGAVDDAGSWEAKIKLGGVSPYAIDSLAAIASTPPQQINALQALGAAAPALQTLVGTTVAKVELAVNVDGYRRRDAQVTNHDLPPEGPSTVPTGMTANDEYKLVQAGMAPSEARAAREAVQSWLTKGGTLRIATNLDQPLPIFRNGSIMTPSFDSFDGFMAATKSRVSN